MLRFSTALTSQSNQPLDDATYTAQVAEAWAALRSEQFPQLNPGARRRNAEVRPPRQIRNLPKAH